MLIEQEEIEVPWHLELRIKVREFLLIRSRAEAA